MVTNLHVLSVAIHELSNSDVFANYTFWHKIIRIKLDHLYRFASYVSFICITGKTT